METRKHLDFSISEIGMGCYGLSGAYGTKDIEEYKRTLRRAYELGVNFFDAAEAYGDAEQVLGEVVKPFREEVIIATKVGAREGMKPNLSEAYVREACEGSLGRLGTEYVDLYQVHFDDPETPIEETVAALETLVKEGKIRHYGLGHLPAERVETYCQTGKVFSVLMEFCAVARGTYQQILPLQKEYNFGMIAFSVTGRGMLTGKIRAGHTFEPGDIRNMDPLFQRARFESGLRVAGKMAQVGERIGKTPAQVAIAWVLAQPGITCALTGPSTIAHLEENLGGSGWQLTPEDLTALETFMAEEDAWLGEEQRNTVHSLLTTPLPDPQQAFVDLVYVIETAINLGMIEESEVLPVFYELFDLRQGLDESARPILENIQEQLRERLI